MTIAEEILQENITKTDLRTLAEYLKQGLSEEDLVGLAEEQKSAIDYSEYIGDELSYVENVLNVKFWSGQKKVILALQDNQKVIVKSGHSVGKSFLTACYANARFDIYDPGIVITTAPTQQGVEDIIWKEIRLLRKGRNMKPRAARMETAPNHFAYGVVTRTGEGFQGRHDETMTICFDEAAGIHKDYWDTADSMINAPGDRFLAILNPLSPNCAAYQEELTGLYKTISISCLDHPNIAAELAGIKVSIPAAVRLNFITNWLTKGTVPVDNSDSIKKGIDIEFPPGSGQWYRPGPEFEGRVLGRYPTSSSRSVWNDALVSFCETERFPQPDLNSKASIEKFIDEFGAPEIGCDTARFGDDYTANATRWGRSIIEAEKYQGLDTAYTAGKLKEMCNRWSRITGISRFKIPVKIEDDGIGGSVVDQAYVDGDKNKERYNFLAITAGSKAIRQKKYSNRRAELWVETSKSAEKGEFEWSRLSDDYKKELRSQCLAQMFDYDARGRKLMISKDKIKKEIGVSPDLMDAVNLASTGFWREPGKEEPAIAEQNILARHADFYARVSKRGKIWQIGN